MMNSRKKDIEKGIDAALEHVTQLSDRVSSIQSRLTRIEESIGSIDKSIKGIQTMLDKTDTHIPSLGEVAQTPAPINEIIAGNGAPWVLEALKWDGKSEIYDQEELTEFLGFNPNGNDPDGLPWCAGFWKAILSSLNMDISDLGNSVDSFLASKAFTPCEEVNGAFLIFKPKQGSRHKISHIGVKIQDTYLLGGNQGDSVKKSNLQWYKDNAKLEKCLCPNGYTLIEQEISV